MAGYDVDRGDKGSLQNKFSVKVGILSHSSQLLPKICFGGSPNGIWSHGLCTVVVAMMMVVAILIE